MEASVEDGTAPHNAKLTVFLFLVTTFVYGIMFSVLGSFFPAIVKGKGLDATVTGLILCAYELVAFINMPIIGAYLTKIGPRFIFLAGLFASGYCCILFAFMDQIHGNTLFTIFCFVVRTVQAIGGSSMLTSIFALVAHAYPERMTTLFAVLESIYGVGLIAGYPLGGWLYQMGGFKLPFLVPGSALVFIALVMFFLLPYTASEREETEQYSILKFARSAYVMLLCYFLVVSAMCGTMLDVTLSLVLNTRYDLNPLQIGLVFLVFPAMYSLVSVALGYCTDKRPSLASVFLLSGYAVGTVAFILIGPMPTLGIATKPLWLVVIALFLCGVGFSTSVTVAALLNLQAVTRGFPAGLATNGLVSGVYNSAFSLGGFIGPLLGGYLTDLLTFDWSTTIFGGLVLLGVVLLTGCQCVRYLCSRPPNDVQIDQVTEERANLIQASDT